MRIVASHGEKILMLMLEHGVTKIRVGCTKIFFLACEIGGTRLCFRATKTLIKQAGVL